MYKCMFKYINKVARCAIFWWAPSLFYALQTKILCERKKHYSLLGVTIIFLSWMMI